MEFRAVHNAEIEARLAQSHRYDILHAAVDDCLAGAPRNWNRRLVCGLLLENMLVITPPILSRCRAHRGNRRSAQPHFE